ncbi:hypothetical protein OROGR_011806 [Orobanche gracilis]
MESIGIMSSLTNDDEDVFLDEDDIIEEISVDEEDLPEADDDDDDADEASDEEADDSVHIFSGHTGEVYTVACSPIDPTLVATGAGDDKGFLWKVGGQGAFELKGHKDSVSCVSFSCDGQLVASGSFDGVIKVWDILSEKLDECRLKETGSGIEWVRWHPRGRIVLAGSDSTVWMWWYAPDTLYDTLYPLSGHAGTVTCGDFTPDGKTICTGSDDATLRIWNPKTRDSIHVFKGHTEGLTCLAITADSSLVLTGSKDGSVHIVRISTGKVVASLTSHTGSIECIGLSSSSLQWAATGSMDRKLIIWDLQQSVPVERCTCEHREGVTCVSWLGRTRFVATGCVDGRVRIWDSLNGKCVKILRGHTDAVQSIAISAHANHLVSVSLDGTARVFQIHQFFN